MADNINTTTSTVRPPVKAKRKVSWDTYGWPCSCSIVNLSTYGLIFRALFYRIWLYRKHNIFITLLQILIPCLLIIGGAYIQADLLPRQKTFKTWTNYPITTEKMLYDGICGEKCNFGEPYIISYYPQSSFTDELVKVMKQEVLSLQTYLEFTPVKTERKIVQLAVRYHLKNKTSKYIGGIIFDLNPHGVFSPPPKLKFVLRMAQYIPRQIQPFASFSHERNYPQHYTPLMGIELAVTRAYMRLIEAEAAKKKPPGKVPHSAKPLQNIESINVQPFPYPPHGEYRGQGEHKFNWIITSSIVLGMTVVVFSFVRGPVSEKETGFKLGLRLMGLPQSAFWFGWILNQLIVQVVTLSIQVALLFVEFNESSGPLVLHGQYSLWFVTLMLYTLASLSFFCCLASFFKRSVMATYVVATTWLLTYYFVDVYIPSYDADISTASKFAICLLPNGGLLWAIMLLTTSSIDDWQSLNQPLSSNGVTLAYIMTMFVFEFCFYFSLTIYIDNLKPGPFESIQPWNYFFDGIKCKYGKDRHRSTSLKRNTESQVPSIEFQEISKTYHRVKGVYAVDNVSLNIYPGKITVLLGHSGAGKSTLVRLLCGEYFPSSGTAFVNGYDIRYYRPKASRYISVCFQRNLLCEYLTVTEHLLLIAKLKGVHCSKRKQAVRKLLTKFDLTGVKNTTTKHLLSHEKRLLSLALALVGNTPIIILDNATTGLEPELKIQIWNYLKELRDSGHTLLVTTACMDEAYMIGDRIALMSKGKIVGTGSGTLLERLYATGYHLKVELQPEANKNELEDFVKSCIQTTGQFESRPLRISRAMDLADVDADTDQSEELDMDAESFYLACDKRRSNLANPSVTVMKSQGAFKVDMARHRIGTDDGDEAKNSLLLLLPKRETAHFYKLFSALQEDAIRTKYGIIGYRLKLYTMEEAFLEIDQYMELNDDSASLSLFDEDIEAPIVPVSSPLQIPSLKMQSWASTTCLGLHRLGALITKRFMWIKGRWLYCSVQILVPLLLLIFTIGVTNEYYDTSTEPYILNYDLKNMFPRVNAYYRHSKTSGVADLISTYKAEVAKRGQVPIDIDEETFLAHFGKLNNKADLRPQMYQQLVIGADFSNEANPVAMFSTAAFHAGPLSLMHLLNAVLKYRYDHDDPAVEFSIQCSSHPIDHTDAALLKFYATKDESYVMESSMTFAIILGFGFFVFASGFVTQPAGERLSELKRLQLNTSVNPLSYWFAMFIVDFIASIITACLLVGALWYFPPHSTFQDLLFIQHFFIFWLLASYSSIMLSYIFSFHFKRSSTSFYGMLSCNQVAGLFMFLLAKTFVPTFPGRLSMLVLHMLQPYCIPAGLYNLFTLALRNARCKLMSKVVLDTVCDRSSHISGIDKSCCDRKCIKNGDCKELRLYLDWQRLINPEILESFFLELICLIIHAIFLTFILYLSEKRMRLWSPRVASTPHEGQTNTAVTPDAQNTRKKKRSKIDTESTDHERYIVENALNLDTNIKGTFFIAKGLTKRIRNRQIITNITFVAEPGKLCCIVGPSGSGKTVLFQVLAKIRAHCDGDVYFNKSSLKASNVEKFFSKIGFCPSTDITIPRMTGLQTLKLFGRLKGVHENILEERTALWIKQLGLEKELPGKCEFYSDSAKRRLAIACCMIGDPKVIILDEPLKDLDPASRMKFWVAIEHFLALKKIVIIFSSDVHSVQWHCSKLLILVNGHLRYAKSPMEMIKETNIGSSVTLSMRLRTDSNAKITFQSYVELKRRIQKAIPAAVLQEELHDSLLYRISQESAQSQWSELFGNVEKIKEEYLELIQDYEIRETVLKDVYNAFAANQHKYRSPPTTWDEFCFTYC